jgi:hypothetical protein
MEEAGYHYDKVELKIRPGQRPQLDEFRNIAVVLWMVGC